MSEEKEWPLVTVFTLVYNTGKYVVQALESVKANNYPNLQHIIIDDCSTDGVSVNLVEQWIDLFQYPCTFIKHEVNQGICKSLNEIVKLAKGKYMFGVSDDLITKTRIFDHVQIFETSNDNVAVVYGDVSLINSEGEITSASVFKNIIQEFGEVPEGMIYYNLFRSNFIPAAGATMRVDKIVDLGGFDESLFFEDWDMWLRLSKVSLFKKDLRLAAYYRRYSDSTWNLNNIKNFECVLQTLKKNASDKLAMELAAPLFEYYAELYYKLEGKNAYKFFYESLSLRMRFKILCFLLFSLLGFKYATLIKIGVIKNQVNKSNSIS